MAALSLQGQRLYGPQSLKDLLSGLLRKFADPWPKSYTMPCILTYFNAVTCASDSLRAETHLFSILHGIHWRRAKIPDPALFTDGSLKVPACGYASLQDLALCPAALGCFGSPVAYETQHH